MWGSRQEEDGDALSHRLLATYERQLEELEMCCGGSMPWDGHCGLVKVCDEDLVRPSEAGEQGGSSPRTPREHGLPTAAEAGGGGRRAAPPPSAPSGAASLPAPAGTVEQLEEQATESLHRGQPQQAVRLLYAALQRCPLSQVDAAARVISRLLEAELEVQDTPTASRHATDEGEGDVPGAAAASTAGLAAPQPPAAPQWQQQWSTSSGGSAAGLGGGAGPAARELRYALEALGGREPRRALQHLQLAEAACPPALHWERRRIALWRHLEDPQSPSPHAVAAVDQPAANGVNGAVQQLPSPPSWLAATAGRSLFVQVLGATGLPAADSNGLSDPYCVIMVGTHRAITSTKLKTLSPQWNETFVFSTGDVAEAVGQGRPRVALQVYDWDMVSADDFLGQAEVPFESVAQARGPAAITLSLYAHAGGKREATGQLRLAAWFGPPQAPRPAADAGEGEGAGAPALVTSSLCAPAGGAHSAPLVLHTAQCTLYEEPLMACLAVTLEEVTGVHVPGGSGGAGTRAESPAHPDAARERGGPRRRLTGLLGRIGPKPPRLGRSASNVSRASSGGVPGEDDYEDLDFFGSMEPGPVGPTRANDARRALAPAPEDGAATPRPPAGTPPGTPPSAGGAARRGGHEEGHLSGKLLYARLLLGSQEHVSWVRHERRDGSATWQQTLVFAVPLPIRNRRGTGWRWAGKLHVELYRTSRSTSRGRIISIAEVDLWALLPDAHADPLATRATPVRLTSLHRGQAGGEAALSAALVDADGRRQMYGARFVEAAGADAAVDGVGVLPLVLCRAPASGEEQFFAAAPHLARLESATPAYTRRELRKKAKEESEASYQEWLGSWHHQALHAARRGLDRGASWARALAEAAPDVAARQLSWLMGVSSDAVVAATPPLPLPAAPAGGVGGAPAAGAPAGEAQQPPALPQPPARLRLKLHCIDVDASAAVPPSADLFVLLKCGPYWGRSRLLPRAGGAPAVPVGWEVELPVLDVATLLLAGVFVVPRKGLQPAALLAAPAQMLGKLRVRLSCVRPGRPVSADLPILSERDKGAKRVGQLSLTLQVNFADHKALLRSYAAPPLPKAAYYLGVNGSEYQRVLHLQSRRVVLRWLESANPAVRSEEALALLDTERERFAMSRLRVNWRRIQMALAAARRFGRWFDRTCKRWEDPAESAAVVAALVALCFWPRAAVPALLGWAIWAALQAVEPDVAGLPPEMEQDPPGVEDANMELDAKGVQHPVAVLRQKLETLQRILLVVQNVFDDVAAALERLQALLTFQDPTASAAVLAALGGLALLTLALGGATVLAFALFWIVRPPRLRTPTPAPPAVFFGRLPTRGDRVM
eukprot:scaffold8.g1355.t1